ncbi:MAG: hypothetical protein ABR553_04290 [Gammaproteobacteria bacterium]
MPQRRSRAGLLTATLAAASLNLHAAEWLAEPSVTARLEYNDNIRLLPVAQDDVWGAILDPRLKLSRRSPLWDMIANGRLRASEYQGQDGLNTVDNFFDAQLTRRFERGSFAASAGVINDTTLQNESLDLDTGLSIRQIDRSQQTLNLVARHQFTQSTSVEASAGYGKVDYDDGARYGYYGYTYLVPKLRLIHQYTPKTQFFADVSHTQVEYDRSDELESKTDALQIGAAYDITETWQIRGSAGSRRTRTQQLVPIAVPIPGFEAFFPFIYAVEGVSRESETTGLVYDAALTRRFETGRLSLNTSRSIQPSSYSTDTSTTTVNLEGERRLSAKLSTHLAVNYLQSESVDSNLGLYRRDSLRIVPRLSWRLDRDLTLGAGYAYTRVKRGSSGDVTADSNAVFASLSYSWPRLAVSR